MPDDELLAKRIARIDQTITALEADLVDIFDALNEAQRLMGYPPLRLVTDNDE